MFDKKTVEDFDFNGKKALVRVDFNVPIKDGQVGDDTRIRAALPTIQYLLDHGASVILMSHLGRPKGGPDPKYSLQPVATYLGNLLGKEVKFSPDAVGPQAEELAASLKAGDVLLLENTRFHPTEEKNDLELAKQLAALGDVFVMDAFGSAHRAHSSTEGVARYLPAVAGFLMQKEIQYLGQAIADPKRPFVTILGGAKISDKIGVIRNLLTKADKILIGGGMANTFFKAQGYNMGDSLVEAEALETAKELLGGGSDKLMLPVDVVIADKFDAEAAVRVVPAGDVPDGWRVLDIGPETVRAFGQVISTAGTVVWNGPMGVFELAPFAKGTYGIAQAVADSAAVSIIGGGASLEMLEGQTLPGVAALQDK